MTYSTGTITLTNGSATVTGSGTSWVDTVRQGWLLLIPGEGPLLVQSVASNTSLTLARAYQGTTRAGQVYNAIPTQGELAPFVTQIQSLLSTVQSTIDNAGQGKFAAGTASLPSVRGVADADTGLNFAGSNLLEFIAGGGIRALLSSTAFNFSVPITGTAVTQSANDTTTGRLLKVGDFGVGGAVLSGVTDLNNATTPGEYAIQTTTTLNKPGISGGAGVLQVQKWGAADIIQRFTTHFPAMHSGRVFVRAYQGGAWQSWRELYSQQGILGTVAQASGVPTGAVIERGSNANGEYVRFADGTQICTALISLNDSNLAANSIFTSPSEASWTFPAAFTATTGLFTSASVRSGSNVWARGRPASPTSALVKLFSAGAITGTFSTEVYAAGRWF